MEGGDTAPSLWGKEGTLADGIRQGLLGDGWLLGSASALAEHSARVHRLFTQESYPADGIFEATLYFKGRPYKVVIDDRLPLYSENTPIATQRSVGGAWWGPLLEKAFAKMHQNYIRLSGGLSFEALRALTGMPTVPHLPKYYSS